MWKPCLRALTRTLSGLHHRSTHRCSPRNSTLRQRNCLHSPNTPSLLFASTISSQENACFLPARYYILSSRRALVFYSPSSFKLWDLEKGHSCWGGVSRVHHREIQAEGILEPQRGIRLHTSRHGSSPRHAPENRGCRSCNAVLQLLNPMVELDGNVTQVPKALQKCVITSL